MNLAQIKEKEIDIRESLKGKLDYYIRRHREVLLIATRIERKNLERKVLCPKNS